MYLLITLKSGTIEGKDGPTLRIIIWPVSMPKIITMFTLRPSNAYKFSDWIRPCIFIFILN